MHKRHLRYGLIIFVIVFGLGEVAGLLNRNPAAGPQDFIRGALIAFVLSIAVATIAVIALRHSEGPD